jgi:bisphosphoglycerate-independent phosphoglycerate mutase (AlkP superfamily)
MIWMMVVQFRLPCTNTTSHHITYFFNDGKEKKYMEKSQEYLEMTGWARQGQLGRELVALT